MSRGVTTPSPAEVQAAVLAAQADEAASGDRLTQFFLRYPSFDVDTPITTEMTSGSTTTTTMLYTASRSGHLNSVYALLSRGANPNRRVQNSNTPFLVACFRGRVDVVDAMFRFGKPRPDVTLTNSQREGPVSVFAAGVHVSAVLRIKQMCAAPPPSQVMNPNPVTTYNLTVISIPQSAAPTTAPAPPPPVAAAPTSNNNTSGGDDDDDSGNLCVICMTNTKQNVCVPCGHRCFCEDESCKAGAMRGCPICRRPVTSVMRVFM